MNTFLAVKGVFNFLSDEKFLKMRYKLCVGRSLDLNEPKTFNEKIQWLKIHKRLPKYISMVDKISVKDYVSEIIGEEYVIPTLGVWDKAEDVDFDSLPNQFVLKCNHDSGGIVICKNKSDLDKQSALKKLKKALKRNPYNAAREWPYKSVQRRILAEEYLEDDKLRELRDYKFFTFNGEVKALFVASDRQDPNKETKFDFFDSNYNRLPIVNGHPNSEKLPEKPENFELMKELAKKLGQGMPHVRVDFYEVNGRVYFGELTFYHYGGLVAFEPNHWDEVFGSWIDLTI
ncbi:MAG: glycosyl transferase [Clostridia bacterium]|nr:glycosyl transferase [Clostridia bacterium]